MSNIIMMQSVYRSSIDPKKICSFDIESISQPTAPLIHQMSRFWLIREGYGCLRLQDREYELKPGTAVSVLPWQISEIVRVDVPLSCHIVAYNFESINQIIKSFYNVGYEPLSLIKDLEHNPVLYCDERQGERLADIFTQIQAEAGIESLGERPDNRPEKPDETIYITNKLVELVLQINRIGRQNSRNDEKKPRTVTSSEIFPYIYNHLSEKITLTSLSKLFFMSESAISQYITGTTGLSFFDLLNEMRVGKTINFLLYTDFTLEELAEILGFVDSSHISKVFAARMGMKVNEYRKTYQKVNQICRIKEKQESYQIISYLYRNYAEELQPHKVAEKFRITLPELNRIMLYQVEKNFSDFLNYIRVNRACELLVGGDMSIARIAVEVGYNCEKTLNRNFLKFKVITPGQFRKRGVSRKVLESECLFG